MGEKGQDASDEDVDAKALEQSSQIHDAMKLTAKLWSRTEQVWGEDAIDQRSTTVQDLMQSLPTSSAWRKSKKQQSRVHPKAKQSRAYIEWKESCVKDWLRPLRQGQEAPTAEQLEFLEAGVQHVCLSPANAGLGAKDAASDRRAARLLRRRRRTPKGSMFFYTGKPRARRCCNGRSVVTG